MALSLSGWGNVISRRANKDDKSFIVTAINTELTPRRLYSSSLKRAGFGPETPIFRAGSVVSSRKRLLLSGAEFRTFIWVFLIYIFWRKKSGLIT